MDDAVTYSNFNEFFRHQSDFMDAISPADVRVFCGGIHKIYTGGGNRNELPQTLSQLA